MTKRWLFLAFAIAPLACTSSTSGGDQSCTLVGCEDGVAMDLGALATTYPNVPLAVHVCLDDKCQDAVVTASSCDQAPTGSGGSVPALVLLCMPYGDGHVHILANAPNALADPTKTQLAISVTDATGAKVYEHVEWITLTSTQPNGPKCEPTCHQGSFAISP